MSGIQKKLNLLAKSAKSCVDQCPSCSQANMLNTCPFLGQAEELHNFQDKVWIMQAARKAQSLVYKGAKIMIFKVFSAVVVRRRQEFYKSLKREGSSSLCCIQLCSELSTTDRSESLNILKKWLNF
ncbi:hypothetical protein XENORESO_000693 [Xenotaenia resolanae]|uniref:Uncharacterized protein n=1 Tax=Xenotaenia resolanae TaxID=208358 RepID=A0ABV0VTB6_9TELE